MFPDIETLRGLVIEAAEEELLPRFAEAERHYKADGSVVTEADFAVQRRLKGELAGRWPDFAFLGEEMPPEAQRRAMATGSLWCLDPLDGTNNFIAGIPYFSVSLALISRGEVALGLIYDPIRRECFWAQRGRGAFLNHRPLRRRAFGIPLRRAIAAIDFKRLDKELAVRLVTSPPYASQRSFGSIALDWCWTAAGRFHVYLHGRQKVWDYAAGSLILDEAGGRALTLEGEAVFLPEVVPRSVAASLDGELFEAWCAWLRGPPGDATGGG